MSLSSLPPLRSVVDQYAIWPEKRLGQNFLFDLQLTDRIARVAGDISASFVLEIGPGPGGLTRSLLENNAKKVVVVEQDSRCIQALKAIEACVSGRLEIVQGDALSIAEETLLPGPFIIIANLPYNISTVLLFKWLDKLSVIKSMTLMFQKEVADRIMAAPGSKSYGRLSVMTQWLCTVKHQFDINPRAFFPPPKITSSVITITPRKEPLAPAEKAALERLCKAVFGQRRKTLRVSLKQLTDTPEELLERAGIEGQRRPEELCVEELCRLAEALQARGLTSQAIS